MKIWPRRKVCLRQLCLKLPWIRLEHFLLWALERLAPRLSPRICRKARRLTPCFLVRRSCPFLDFAISETLLMLLRFCKKGSWVLSMKLEKLCIQWSINIQVLPIKMSVMHFYSSGNSKNKTIFSTRKQVNLQSSNVEEYHNWQTWASSPLFS